MLVMEAPLAHPLMSISDHVPSANTAAKMATAGRSATRILAHGAGWLSTVGMIIGLLARVIQIVRIGMMGIRAVRIREGPMVGAAASLGITWNLFLSG